MKRFILAFILVLAPYVAAQTGDILGAHNLGQIGGQVSGGNSAACLYCHAPHSGTTGGALWGQSLSTQVYSVYNSDTVQNKMTQPALGQTSVLCLSCHDGTVAPGQFVVSGQIQMTGKMTDVFGKNLANSHPFSLQLPLKDAASLVDTLASSGKTADATGSVKLVKGNVECNSCHDGHNQYIDKLSLNFLVRDNSKGAICLSCHETKPRTVNNLNNPISGWTTGIHATSSAQVNPSAGIGSYGDMASFACQSCHATHNASSNTGLLRVPKNPYSNVDASSQTCLICHDGSNNMLQPILNVLAETQKKAGHPFASTSNVHTPSEPVIVNQNRHASCADCHNSHASQQTQTFSTPPTLRPSQMGVTGVATDGSLLNTAVNQYENCLRCHGSSTGKQALALYGYLPARMVTGGDPLNVNLEFGTTSASRHPVMQDRKGGSQPSLLTSMWNISGQVQGRPMGTRILCTDCHNADDNREFGGVGPNGPHGSNNWHILERRYESSQVAVGTWPNGGIGTLITGATLFPNAPLGPGTGGPFELCAKCHNLSNVVSDASFKNHKIHVQTDGISCSTCHDAHGTPAGGATTGTRLINFDTNVVAPYKGTLSYNGNTCTLTCHMMIHQPNGQVKKANPNGPPPF